MSFVKGKKIIFAKALLFRFCRCTMGYDTNFVSFKLINKR
nr:MAG TPA: hypothetical protein [Microviridae sp.]